MLDLKKIEEIIVDQLANFSQKNSGTERLIDFNRYLSNKQIVVISGIRRSGKSTLLKQLANKLKDFHYINFDDERLINFTIDDFNNLLVVWQKRSQSHNILIDEIQNINKWERFIRRIHDEGYKIFLTGSNAKLLSSELATHLTGRYIKIELYPFSFHEFLKFHNVTIEPMSSKTKARVLTLFDSYLINGGFPEFLKYGDKEFIIRTYEDIIYRDIISRFRIKEVKAFRELANFIFTNFTKEISYNSLSNILGIKSVVSVKNYIGFLEETYLVFELFKYDFSLKKQFISNKKAYIIDNGIRNNVAFYFSQDRGRLLENIVFLELKRRQKEIYYFRDKGECDFIVRDKDRILKVIQVTQNINKTNELREFSGLIEAIKQFKLKEGLILTDNQEDKLKKDGFLITIMPIWRWLMEI